MIERLTFYYFKEKPQKLLLGILCSNCFHWEQGKKPSLPLDFSWDFNFTVCCALFSCVFTFLLVYTPPSSWKGKGKKNHFALWEMGSFAPDLQKQSIL
jgi:hypothetical protein